MIVTHAGFGRLGAVFDDFWQVRPVEAVKYLEKDAIGRRRRANRAESLRRSFTHPNGLRQDAKTCSTKAPGLGTSMRQRRRWRVKPTRCGPRGWPVVAHDGWRGVRGCRIIAGPVSVE